MGARELVSEKNGNEGGILFALEYLVSEARRENSKRLLLILESALTLAKSKNSAKSSENDSTDNDTLNATYFLLKFLEASNEVQEHVLKIIEKDHFEHEKKKSEHISTNATKEAC